MERKIEQKMLEWKRNSAGHTALLIDGARRTGKSYSAEAFARKYYRSYILIDFNRAGRDVMDLFEHYLNNLDDFFMYLSAMYSVRLYKGESLIILDEIQLFPRARAAVKYLVADGRYHYMETGSLLSVRNNISDIVIPSEERHIKMYPMDYEEFLLASGEEPLMEAVRSRYESGDSMGEALHRRAMNLFRQYLLIGGMPQAVSSWTENRDFEEADSIKRDILSLYRQDIVKHARGYERKVESVFDEIPEQLSRHEKKFVLSSLGTGSRFRDYEDSFMWLENSMICNICYNSTEPSVGIRLNRDRTTMKIYMGDTGLLISHAFDENGLVSEEVYKKILSGKLEFNEGMIFENIAAQMLTAAGHRLYFYSSSSRTDKESRMEIDFLLTGKKIGSRHNVSPVEVKSGKRYTYSSLKKFMAKYKSQLNSPFIIHTGDYMEKEGIIFLPVYMTGLL